MIRKEKGKGIPIENSMSYNNWAVDYSRANRKQFDQMFTVLKDNRKDFRKLFGQPDGLITAEFKFDFWKVVFENERFLLCTAKTKGTCIEITDTTYEEINKKADVIIRFVKNLMRMLKILRRR